MPAANDFLLEAGAVLVPARVAYLWQRFGLIDRAGELSTRDSESGNVAQALSRAANSYARTASGYTAHEPTEAQGELSLSSKQAAVVTGMTDRGIRKAIERGELVAMKVGNRYQITSESLGTFRTK